MRVKTCNDTRRSLVVEAMSAYLESYGCLWVLAGVHTANSICDGPCSGAALMDIYAQSIGTLTRDDDRYTAICSALESALRELTQNSYLKLECPESTVFASQYASLSFKALLTAKHQTTQVALLQTLASTPAVRQSLASKVLDYSFYHTRAPTIVDLEARMLACSDLGAAYSVDAIRLDALERFLKVFSSKNAFGNVTTGCNGIFFTHSPVTNQWLVDVGTRQDCRQRYPDSMCFRFPVENDAEAITRMVGTSVPQ